MKILPFVLKIGLTIILIICLVFVFFILSLYLPSILFENGGNFIEIPSNETLFFLFYNYSGSTAFYPEPSEFSLYFTSILGIILGFYISKKYIWYRFTK